MLGENVTAGQLTRRNFKKQVDSCRETTLGASSDSAVMTVGESLWMGFFSLIPNFQQTPFEHTPDINVLNIKKKLPSLNMFFFSDVLRY